MSHQNNQNKVTLILGYFFIERIPLERDGRTRKKINYVRANFNFKLNQN